MDIVGLLMLLVGLALGVAGGWASATMRGSARIRSAEISAAQVHARWEAEQGSWEQRTAAERDAAHLRQTQLEEQLAREATRATEREAELRAEHERYVTQVRADQETLRTEFKALSAEALRTNNQQFLEVAGERFKRAQQLGDADLAKREEAVRQMVEPMRAALDEVKRQTTEADKARAETQAHLTEQIRRMLDTSEQLGKQTENLRSALRRPEVRGRWGELHLRRVVEVAGLVNGVDFEEQLSNTADDGARLRPDMIVTLSGGRKIVVDAKAPLDALLDLDSDPENADTHADRHVANVRKRVKELGSKAYRDQFGSKIDFTVLFLPAESFLQIAIERDPHLLTDAYGQGVVIATPTVLVAILRTVALAWKEEALAQNAQQVLDTGKQLYERLSTMGSHLDRLGKNLETAGKAYNDLVGSMERRVLPKAREFATLQQLNTETLTAEQRQIDPRELTASELTASELTASELASPTNGSPA